MPDLGHEVSFGISLPNPASQAATVVRLAQLAEDQGLDLIGIQDHPYNPDLLDTWTLLSHLAAATERVRLFPDVTCLPLRPAAVLARSAASLDLLSRGRVELGLGAGLFLDPIAGMGAPALTRGQTVDALAEAIGVIRALWNATEPVTLPGKFHHLQGAAPGPRPDHDIGIWVGSYGLRMLELTARLADGWVPAQGYAGPDDVAALTARLDDLIIDAGREPADLVRIYNINGRFAAGGNGFLDGPPAVWAEQLAELVLLQGFSSFLLAPSGDIISSIQTLAEQVAPDVRDRVARERAGGASDERSDDPAGAWQPTESVVVSGLSDGQPGADGVAATAERPLERDGNWSDAGGLTVTARPRAPVAQGVDGVPHPGGRDNHRNLVAIHDHLRSEMVQILQAVSQVSAGELAPGEARSLISRMTVRQNHWTLGSFCASYCRIVTIHHTVEDAHMFPALQELEPSLEPVLERLGAEHEVIADVLDRFDRALVDLVREQDGTGVPGRSDAAEIAALAAELNDLLLSHLAYEEDELADGLARMPAPI